MISDRLVGTNPAQLYCQLNKPSTSFHVHWATEISKESLCHGWERLGRHPAAGTLTALSEGLAGAGTGPQKQVGCLELARVGVPLPSAAIYRAALSTGSELGNDQMCDPCLEELPFNGRAVVKVICRPQSQPGEPRRDQETELSLGLGGAQPEG